jgi:hypothetical protein
MGAVDARCEIGSEIPAKYFYQNRPVRSQTGLATQACSDGKAGQNLEWPSWRGCAGMASALRSVLFLTDPLNQLVTAAIANVPRWVRRNFEKLRGLERPWTRRGHTAVCAIDPKSA